MRGELIGLAKSIKGRRVLGSLERLEDINEIEVREVAERYGLLSAVYLSPEGGYEVIMCKPSATNRLSQYLAYLRGHEDLSRYISEGKVAGLTPEEHYELGLAFGLPEKETAWFREEMAEELKLRGAVK